MGLVWEACAVAFPFCSQERFPWHEDADLATSVNRDIVWESLSPSLSLGGGRKRPLWPCKCSLLPSAVLWDGLQGPPKPTHSTLIQKRVEMSGAFLGGHCMRFPFWPAFFRSCLSEGGEQTGDTYSFVAFPQTEASKLSLPSTDSSVRMIHFSAKFGEMRGI